MRESPTVPGLPGGLDTRRVADRLRELLPGWLPGQRWFAGKGRRALRVEPGPVAVLSPGDPALLHVVVHIGPDDRYQLLLGMRPTGPGAPVGPVIGTIPGDAGQSAVLYEATADPELMGRLLRRHALGDGREDPQGIAFHRVPGADIPEGLQGRAITAEQSNTSVVYGDRLMLKVLRRPVPGASHELETLTALGRSEDVHSAAPLAWMQSVTRAGEEPLTLGILQEFIPSRGDGWALAVEEAARCIAGEGGPVAPLGGFIDEAHALGRATAQVHTALSRALPTRALSAGEVAGLVATLDDRLDQAVRQVSQLTPYQRQLRDIYEAVGEAARRGNSLVAQRIHGDLHLGQALRGERGWVLIDFEGEPGRPHGERGALQPPLRDVAAMLRSFDYAAHHALGEILGTPPGERPPGDPRGRRLARRASAWAVYNRRAFSEGYAAAGGCDPRCRPVLLRAFEADKAVYEAAYEARNRPEWLPIPMAAVRRLAQQSHPGR